MEATLIFVSNLPEKVHAYESSLCCLFCRISNFLFPQSRADKLMEILEDKLGMGDISALKQIVDYIVSDKVPLYVFLFFSFLPLSPEVKLHHRCQSV